MTQLADDTALFLNDSSQIPVALDVLQSFSKASGLNLNLNKCELLPIKNCSLSSIQNITVKNRVTYLGIHITKDECRCSTNLNPIITNTQKNLNCWLQRDLSLKGRPLLTKAEGLSRLTYAAQSLFVDKPTSKLINEILIKFLWKNKSHYMRKSVVLNSYNNGGLNFIDFDSLNNTFKINWLNQYLTKPSSILTNNLTICFRFFSEEQAVPHCDLGELENTLVLLVKKNKIKKCPLPCSLRPKLESMGTPMGWEC